MSEGNAPVYFVIIEYLGGGVKAHGAYSYWWMARHVVGKLAPGQPVHRSGDDLWVIPCPGDGATIYINRITITTELEGKR